jgi:hypothetical protein
MTTQQFELNYQTKSGDASSLAIIFFLLGAPHIYSALKQRQNRKSTLRRKLLVPKNIGLLVTTIAGATALWAF